MLVVAEVAHTMALVPQLLAQVVLVAVAQGLLTGQFQP
jgi:hypothetical protein